MQKAKPDMVPLSSIFMQMAKELSSVDRQIHAVESLLQQEVIGRVLNGQQIEDLQGVDHARQMLTCLGLFLQSLSEEAAGTIKIDPKPAINDITLKGLAARLSHPESEIEDSRAAHVHFF